MKRMIMAALMMIAMVATVSPAQAARRRTANPRPRPQRVERAPSNGGFFSRMMELERRKNAALRRMFGRS